MMTKVEEKGDPFVPYNEIYFCTFVLCTFVYCATAVVFVGTFSNF